MSNLVASHRPYTRMSWVCSVMQAGEIQRAKFQNLPFNLHFLADTSSAKFVKRVNNCH